MGKSDALSAGDVTGWMVAVWGTSQEDVPDICSVHMAARVPHDSVHDS